jgi:hypothetical protein
MRNLAIATPLMQGQRPRHWEAGKTRFTPIDLPNARNSEI